MTPCTGPSLSSKPANTRGTTCGCASQPAEHAFAYAPNPEREYAFRRETTLSHGMTFYPVHHAVASYEGPVALLVPAWLVVAALVSLSRRGPYILRLGLVGLPVESSSTRRFRLVPSEAERRVLRALANALDPRRFVLAPVALAACAYSQPRLRNHMSMPPPMARHTPQKIG